MPKQKTEHKPLIFLPACRFTYRRKVGRFLFPSREKEKNKAIVISYLFTLKQKNISIGP
jgi:hypothetical protein